MDSYKPETIDLSNILNTIEQLPRVKRGRPAGALGIKGETMTKAEYNKRYYEKNKEKFKGDLVCGCCSCLVNKMNYARHCKSKTHKDNLNKALIEIDKVLNIIET